MKWREERENEMSYILRPHPQGRRSGDKMRKPQVQTKKEMKKEIRHRPLQSPQ
jgi:hypothetical protein